MDALVSNAINGLNAMPPKGLCMTCSDADLKAAVEYMVSQSQ
jgi:cytochrome c5